MNTDTGYLSKKMAMIIHTYNGTTPSCLQRFSLFQMNNNNSTIAAAPQSQFKLAWKMRLMLGYIQKLGDPAEGDANPKEIDQIS